MKEIGWIIFKCFVWLFNICKILLLINLFFNTKSLSNLTLLLSSGGAFSSAIASFLLRFPVALEMIV